MGNCLFLLARGWGIDRQVRKKLQIPGGMPGGGMVTGRIEPCIINRSCRASVLILQKRPLSSIITYKDCIFLLLSTSLVLIKYEKCD